LEITGKIELMNQVERQIFLCESSHTRSVLSNQNHTGQLLDDLQKENSDEVSSTGPGK
jgi:hypothetical protein